MHCQVVELVDGYGVTLTKRQLDEAMDNSSGSPTRLIRNLMRIFFSKEILAISSAYMEVDKIKHWIKISLAHVFVSTEYIP